MLKRFLLPLLFSSLPLFSAAPKIMIGVAGGTGSGKTTLAEKILQAFPGRSILISQDSYYRPLVGLSLEERAHFNFDHPDSLDFSMLRQHLMALKAGDSIQQPIYNFCTHAREPYTNTIEPAELIIVEGILIFAVPTIRDLFDFKVFVDTDDDIRLLRRIQRDMSERARDFTSVKEQYLATVKPMHEAFVQPSKQYADIIVPKGGKNSVALHMILCKLHSDLITSDNLCCKTE